MLGPSLLGFQLQNPSLVCNRIYLFITLLLDATLLTGHPPQAPPMLGEDAERKRVLYICL